MPECDGVGGEVDLVRHVVPHVGGELGLPLRLPARHPAEVGVRGSAGPAQPANLHLGEVALKEVDLVFARRGRRIRVAALHAEVVPHLALVDWGRGLGDQLRASHVLTIPVCRGSQSDLDALLRARVGGILKVG